MKIHGLMSHKRDRSISAFVQSGNFEALSQTGFEPVTLRVTVGSLTTRPNCLIPRISKNFKPNFKRFLQFFSSRVASLIEEQSAISFEKTKNKISCARGI